MLSRAGALLLGAGIATASGFAALIGVFFGFSLKCGDSCSTAPGWREDPTASQWEAFGWVSVAGFAISLVLLATLAFRWTWASLAVLVVWGLLGGVFLTLFADSGLTSKVERGWAGLFLLLLAGLAAIALARRSIRN